MNRYPGGKGLSFRRIINLLPPHETFIETHLGAGAVIRNKRPSGRDIGVEIDGAVVARWQAAFGDRYEVRQDCAHRFLSEYSFTGDEVVYCDPPYLRSTRRGGRLYRHEYKLEDHAGLLDILTTLPCRVLLSGYPNDLYDGRLGGWNTSTFQAKTQAGTATEKLWFNYEPPSCLHDTSYIGDTFREREQVKRRLGTLKRKIVSLHDRERQALLQWAIAEFDPPICTSSNPSPASAQAFE